VAAAVDWGLAAAGWAAQVEEGSVATVGWVGWAAVGWGWAALAVAVAARAVEVKAGGCTQPAVAH